MTRVLADDRAGIAEAGRLLREGGLVAFPTETVYGLGGDATSGAAVRAIYAAKGRPAANPLISHFADGEAALAQAEAGEAARRLAEAFWPGPLTLVLRRSTGSVLAPEVSAGLATAAVRVPEAPVARRLIREAGLPLAAPSANRSGSVSPTEAAHVVSELGGRIAAVLDGGPCRIGLESTVLDCAGEVPRLLRQGAVAAEALRRVVGDILFGAGEGPARSPGLMASHYAPVLPVRLGAVSAGEDEALLAFGPAPAGAGLSITLSEAGDLEEAARRLFAALRALDGEARRRGLTGIAVMAVPERGIGAAINDRLARAAAPRTGAQPEAGFQVLPSTSRRIS